MSYSANKYNYSTPLNSSAGLTNAASVVEDHKYFTLSDNVLDGSYYPISGDVGLWGAAKSDAYGVLPEPFVVTVNESGTIQAFRLVSSKYNYPVAFTVVFYNGTAVQYTIAETTNDKAEYVHYLLRTITVTHYIISVTKVSQPGSAARLYNVYNPAYIKRLDNATLLVLEASYAAPTEIVVLTREDTLAITHRSNTHIHSTTRAHDTLVANADELSHINNTIDVTHDSLLVKSTGSAVMINVHSRMKEPSRRVYGKVYITYTDPMLDSETAVSTDMEAYNSNKDQVVDSTTTPETKLLMLYDNKLDGSYHALDEYSQVGWVSAAISDENGTFSAAPFLRVDFSTRVVSPVTIHFDAAHGSIAEDFTVEFIRDDNTSTVVSIVGNASDVVSINEEPMPAKAIVIRVTKTTRPAVPVAILEVSILSTLLYRGYANVSDLVSIDLLEELTYDDEVEALGGVSANETTIVLDNSTGAFYFNNSKSAVSKLLRRNRKIEPWLGVEVTPGVIEWYKQGTYWSYRWNVPVGNLAATVVGFDTIGLLGTTSYEAHYVYRDKSLGDLIDIVLNDAAAQLPFLLWSVDPALYDVTIPYAWFEPTSHAAALRKISQAYPMHIYCDKDGVICAAPQKLHLDHYYDTWSDSTNVISKEYGSLYTTLPNLVNVTVHIPQLVENTNLVSDNLTFNVSATPTRKLNFSNPYISDIVVTVDKDATVNYTYVVYSWGIEFFFTGAGTVRSISCTGTSLDISNTAILTRRDDNSIRLNGAVTRDVKADFIQDGSLAQIILDRIFSLSAADKYDATVTYRGDIALSINDPILLLDGIAPDNRYNIRRHQLFWNGALTGVADLNT